MDRVYKIYLKMNRTRSKLLKRYYEIYLRVIYCCDIPAGTSIGENVRFPHNALGVVIHPNAVIGRNCSIFQHVTIGGRSGLQEVPIIGDDVVIGANSLVLGPLKIGNGVQIGAGSVVLHDIPDNAVVVGNPAKIIKIGDERIDSELGRV